MIRLRFLFFFKTLPWVRRLPLLNRPRHKVTRIDHILLLIEMLVQEFKRFDVAVGYQSPLTISLHFKRIIPQNIKRRIFSQLILMQHLKVPGVSMKVFKGGTLFLEFSIVEGVDEHILKLDSHG